MRKLNKNFHEQKRTVEAMQGSCSAYGSCACGPVQCACSDQSTKSYSNYENERVNYTNGYKRAAF